MPRAGQLGVVGEDRRPLRPAHPRPRLQVPLEVVGVQLDQPRRQEVAVAVLGPAPARRAPVLDRRDPAVRGRTQRSR